MAFIALCFFSFFLVVSSTMVIVARNPVHAVLYLILGFFNAAGLFLLLGAEFLAMLLVIVYVGAVAVLFLFVVMMLDIKDRPRARLTFSLKGQQGWGALRDLIFYLIPFGSVFAGGGFLLYQTSFFESYLTEMQWQLLAATVLFFAARFVAFSVTKINCFEALRRFLKVVPLPFLLGIVIIAELGVLIWGHPLGLTVTPPAGEALKAPLLNTTLLGHVLYTQYVLPFILSGFVLLVAMIGAITLTLRTREDSKRQKVQAQLARTKDNSIEMVDVPLGQGLEIEKGKS